jgi:hypothetical protein
MRNVGPAAYVGVDAYVEEMCPTFAGLAGFGT